MRWAAGNLAGLFAELEAALGRAGAPILHPGIIFVKGSTPALVNRTATTLPARPNDAVRKIDAAMTEITTVDLTGGRSGTAPS